ARAPRADPAPEEKFAETPPTAPASLPERIERGAGGVRAALAAGYGRLWDRIEVVGSSGPVWILVFPIGFIGNLMGPCGGWRGARPGGMPLVGGMTPHEALFAARVSPARVGRWLCPGAGSARRPVRRCGGRLGPGAPRTACGAGSDGARRGLRLCRGRRRGGA